MQSFQIAHFRPKTMETHIFLRLTRVAGQAKAWLVTFERICFARFFRSNINRSRKKIGHSHILMLEMWHNFKGYRYQQHDTFCRFRMISLQVLGSPIRYLHDIWADVCTMHSPYNVRTMFVQCSYNVRTMAKKVRTMFVQSTTKVRTMLYELLAIVRALYKHCALSLRN